MLKVKLTRDLRKSLLRGHPWVYKQAVEPQKKTNRVEMCEVVDKKSKNVAWGYYDPNSPLAVRVLSLEKKPPNKAYFQKIMDQALSLRKSLFSEGTNCFRLFNGEGDGLPGLVCDVYADVAVIQFDGKGPFEFWDQEFIASWLIEKEVCKGVYFKPRKSDQLEPQEWGSVPTDNEVLVKENGISFLVNFRDGQKTGFFLDQRDNRQYLSKLSKDKSLINLFSYTGGFSLYAGLGGASKVLSVDLSEPALDLAQRSWEQNSFRGNHETLSVDIFKFLETVDEKWDMVMVDPPSLTHSEKNKPQAVQNYVELFSKSAQRVQAGGDLFLSSCSSHISFQDFFEIINESLGLARRKGRIYRVSGQGADHPFPHVCPELRYLKFVHLKID